MAGIIILDEDMQPECQYSNVGLDYDAWKELIQVKKSAEITKYSKKIYAERIQKNEKWYDLAAISRTDSPGVVFCYCYQDTDRLTDSYAAVNNLLAGYAMDMNGTLFIAADDKIYGTNDAQYENCQTTEIPVIQELRSTELSDNLVYFTSDGHRYCGGKGRYRDYIYTYIIHRKKCLRQHAGQFFWHYVFPCLSGQLQRWQEINPGGFICGN